MKRKKFIAVLLAASVLASSAGCSKGFDESMTSIANKACKNVVAADYKKVEGFIDGKNKDLEAAMDLETDDDVVNEAIEIILSTFSYEVDEDSLESDFFGKEGSIDVTFSIVDYESVLDDHDVFRDLDEFESLIEDCDDRIETSITLEFEKVDGDALIVNSDEFTDLFSFKDIEITLAGVLYDHLTGEHYFTGYNYDSATGEYTDTNTIELIFELDDLGTELDWDYSYEIQYGSSGYFGSDLLTKPEGQSTIDIIYEDYSVDILEDGMYLFTLFDGEGNALYSISCDVTHTEPEPEPEPVVDAVSLPYYVDTDTDPFILPEGEYQCEVPAGFTLLPSTDPLVQQTAGNDLGQCTCAYMTNSLNLEFAFVYLNPAYLSYFNTNMQEISDLFSEGLPSNCVVQESYVVQRTIADQTVDFYIVVATNNGLETYYGMCTLDCGGYGFFITVSGIAEAELDLRLSCISRV